MKTILVPVNFTDVSKNAAQFALQLAEQLNYERVVLYNAYETPIPQNSDPMGIVSGPLTMYDVQEFKAISENGLEHLKSTLSANKPTTLTLDTISEYGGMTTLEVDEICEKAGADLIVTGIAEDNFLDETNADAIDLAKSSTVPLIAVPNNCTFKPLNTIVLACDLKKVAETVPFEAIRKLLNATNAKLLVLHIQEKDDEDDLISEESVLHKQFDSFNPEYHHVKNTEFAETVNSFVLENNVDLVITIPKKHGWLEGLFRASHLKALTSHSHIPLLMVHD